MVFFLYVCVLIPVEFVYFKHMYRIQSFDAFVDNMIYVRCYCSAVNQVILTVDRHLYYTRRHTSVLTHLIEY